VWARDAHEFIFSASRWTFFFLFPAGEARGIGSHVCAADLAYTVDSRDILSRRMHMALARVHRTFLAASHSLVLSLFFALVPVAPCSPAVCTNTRVTRVSHLRAYTRTRTCVVQMVL